MFKIYLHKSFRNIAGVDNTIKSFHDKYNDKIHYYDLPRKISNRIHSFKNKPNISTELLNFVNQIELSLAKSYTPALNDSVTKIFDEIESAYQKQQDIYNNPVMNLITLTDSVSKKKVSNVLNYVQKFNDEIAEIEARIKNDIEALSPPKVVKEKRFKFCPECGIKNASNRKKCKGCGHDISDVIPITELEYTAENISYGEDFEYESDDLEVKIKKYTGSSDSVNIPPRIDGLPVTSIGDFAFKGCNSLKSIKIPNSVTSIDIGAFLDCRSLTSITIPEGVTSIGNGAFRGCTSLTSITIPEGVTSIGNGAFRGCTSLTSIKIPEGVTFIGDWAFWGCESLTSVYFPNSLKNIKGDNNTLERFRNEYRDKIRYYKIDTKTARVMKVPDFWKNNFAESQTEPKSNFKYSRTESGIYIDKYVGRNAIVSIPEAIENLPVESIGYRAFDNENLYKVVIPASVKNIVYCAFVSQQLMHVLFKGDNIKMIPQSFIAPQITFYYTQNAIAGILYGISDNNPKYSVNYNAADFNKA